MKMMKKRLYIILMVFALSIGVISSKAFASENSGETPSSYRLDIEGELGEKTAKENIQNPGEYEVTVQVPGASQNEQYAEIIIMADASDSINNAGNWYHFKRMVKALGKDLLAENTSIKLTLMGFGIGAKHAGTFTTSTDLNSFIDNATTEDFLQERSATNCEVGFKFVEEYLNNSPNISQTYVIYLSDAAANMTEKKFDVSDWSSYYTRRYISYIVNPEVYNILEGSDPLPVTEELFPELCEALIALREAYAEDYESVEEQINSIMAEMLDSAKSYGIELVEDVFEMSGVQISGEYSASELEKIFQTYFRAMVGKENQFYENYMDFFYVCYLIPMNQNMPDNKLRAAQASLSLQNSEKVLGLYHVCYSRNSNNWMNPEYAKEAFNITYTDKVEYLYGANFGEAIEELEKENEKIVTTIYKDVVVTDPMSQWVILEPSTIAIYYDGEKIYQYGEGEGSGWLIENPPVVDEAGEPIEPIVLTVNDKGFYEITWHVKTGNLLLNDHFSMKYTVNLNEDAEGFVFGSAYPLNDPTSVAYIDEEGEKQIREIKVPEGVVYTVAYVYVSDTPGKDLPEEFVAVPVDLNSYNDNSSVIAQMPEVLTFKDSKNNGVWIFKAWDEDSKLINGANIVFTGKWTFKANGPLTGDNSNLMLWLSIALSSILVVVFIGKKKQKNL